LPQGAPVTCRLKTDAAAKRYEIEQVGTTVSDIPVASDDRCQMMVAEVNEGKREDQSGWKFADGAFLPVSKADFVALADTCAPVFRVVSSSNPRYS
jgi:hypothetical protein